MIKIWTENIYIYIIYDSLRLECTVAILWKYVFCFLALDNVLEATKTF